MEVVLEFELDARRSQVLFGEFRTRVKAILKNAEALAKVTEGMVYFSKERIEMPRLDVGKVLSGLASLYGKIVDELENVIYTEIEKTKSKEITIDIEKEVNSEKIKEIIEEFKRAQEEERIKYEEEKRLQQEIREVIEKLRHQGIKVETEYYAVKKKATLYIEIDKNHFVRVSKIVEDSYADLLENLKRITPIEVYKKYTKQLREKIQELEAELSKTKEEIVKELYESGESVEVREETTKYLKVVEEDSY